ncbi:MAG: hypothetical protein KJ574_00055 [Nanoarchaeota archaeon]|nr:hypothetical protein [Nanoarchaeota archaeon]
MEKIFFKFDFDEPNLSLQKEEIISFLEQHRQNNNIKFFKAFPPCILPKELNLAVADNMIKLSDHQILVSHNLYFGQKYKSINRQFIVSPFISTKCKQCQYFRTAECRGLFNQKLVDKKNALIERIGKDAYESARGDYENGTFTCGTNCQSRCRFCLDGFLPDTVMRRIPLLAPDEIMHFLHYLSKKITYVASSFHSKSGELLDSPYCLQILKLLKYFMAKPGLIITNGKNLSKEAIEIMKDLNVDVGISVNTFNPELRARFTHDKGNIPYIEKINLLRNKRISYHTSIVPFNTLIETGDIFDTIEMLLANDPRCIIRINPPSSSKYSEPEMIKELAIDYEKLKKELTNKYSDNMRFSDDADYERNALLKELLMKTKENLEKICSDGKKTLILCPESSFDQLKTLASDSITVRKVDSSLEFTKPSTGVLIVEDYRISINKEPETFERIILPRNSFDVNFDDISLININELWKGLSNKNISLVFI